MCFCNTCHSLWLWTPKSVHPAPNSVPTHSYRRVPCSLWSPFASVFCVCRAVQELHSKDTQMKILKLKSISNEFSSFSNEFSTMVHCLCYRYSFQSAEVVKNKIKLLIKKTPVMFLSRIIEHNTMLSTFMFISCSLLCRGRAMHSQRHLLNSGNIDVSNHKKKTKWEIDWW